MIKIYSKEEIENVENYIVDSWSFPIEELDYLLEEHNNESFVLINNRLYELDEELLNDN